MTIVAIKNSISVILVFSSSSNFTSDFMNFVGIKRRSKKLCVCLVSMSLGNRKHSNQCNDQGVKNLYISDVGIDKDIVEL